MVARGCVGAIFCARQGDSHETVSDRVWSRSVHRCLHVSSAGLAYGWLPRRVVARTGRGVPQRALRRTSSRPRFRLFRVSGPAAGVTSLSRRQSDVITALPRPLPLRSSESASSI